MRKFGNFLHKDSSSLNGESPAKRMKKESQGPRFDKLSKQNSAKQQTLGLDEGRDVSRQADLAAAVNKALEVRSRLSDVTRGQYWPVGKHTSTLCRSLSDFWPIRL